MAVNGTTHPRRSIALALAVVTCGFVIGGPAALAADGHASCMGLEASTLSPPGSSDEAPGGMKDFAAFAKANFSPPGTLDTTFAHLHAGSHDACDEAVGG